MSNEPSWAKPPGTNKLFVKGQMNLFCDLGMKGFSGMKRKGNPRGATLVDPMAALAPDPFETRPQEHAMRIFRGKPVRLRQQKPLQWSRISPDLPILSVRPW